MIRQPPRRTASFAVPGPHRQRPTGGRDGFEQRTAQQGQRDAATDGQLSPGARLLHSARSLRHKEVRLYWRVTEPLTAAAVEELVAATRRAAAAERLALSADGAEAVVRHAAVAFLPAPVPLAAPPAAEMGGDAQPVVIVEPEVIIEEPPPVIIKQAPAQLIEVIQAPVYVPVPTAGWSGRLPKRRRPAPPGALPQQSHPGPTHMPFGASHMPFGASHSKSPSLSGFTDRPAESRERREKERTSGLRMP